MPIVKDLTVAIVTHGRPDALKKCLQSLCNQTCVPREILIVDNDPQKSARQVVASFKKTLPLIWVHIKRVGIPVARNSAMSRCRTKYLAFVDDDCVLNKHWMSSAHLSISTDSRVAFVVGKTSLLNNRNFVAKVQFETYRNWFRCYHMLDTKNVVLNLIKLKGFRFDTEYAIFEDVDFDRQLNSANLVGSYNPKMLLHHPETGNILKALKKNYLRGQYKSKVTSKWGNFDDFAPAWPRYVNFFDYVFKLVFLLGYLEKPPQLITVVSNHDRGANGERLEFFYKFLRSHHKNVRIINSQLEFRKAISSKKYLFIYGYPFLKYKVLKILHDRFSIDQSSRILLQTLRLRRSIVHRLLTNSKTSLAIIQYPEDMMVATFRKRNYLTLYDSATIYFRELELSNRFTTEAIFSLKQIESEVYRCSDFVSFHWYVYVNLAKGYGMELNNLINLNWGCELHPDASLPYSKRNRVVYVGKLNSYWINPILIKNISQLVAVDFYSYESPDPQFYKNLKKYKGYLPPGDSIAGYRFGLITITKDDLRSQGFSAKQLYYLNHGLPILCPEWRKDKLLEPATIYYNEENINRQIKKYSQKHLWIKKHRAALRIAKMLNWNTTLLPLLEIVDLKNKQYGLKRKN